MTKDEARKKAKNFVASISDAEKEWASGAIVDMLTSRDFFRDSRRPFVYLSTADEPDTYNIVELFFALERIVSVPRVKGDDMEAVIITPFTSFKRNQWNIEEPVGGHVTDEVDLAIVPLVAFDGLKRVGRGKGYYDRFFASHPNCFKVGLAFSRVQFEGIETEPHDVELDVIITEKHVIKCQNADKNIFLGE